MNRTEFIKTAQIRSLVREVLVKQAEMEKTADIISPFLKRIRPDFTSISRWQFPNFRPNSAAKVYNPTTRAIAAKQFSMIGNKVNTQAPMLPAPPAPQKPLLLTNDFDPKDWRIGELNKALTDVNPVVGWRRFLPQNMLPVNSLQVKENHPYFVTKDLPMFGKYSLGFDFSRPSYEFKNQNLGGVATYNRGTGWKVEPLQNHPLMQVLEDAERDRAAIPGTKPFGLVRHAEHNNAATTQPIPTKQMPNPAQEHSLIALGTAEPILGDHEVQHNLNRLREESKGKRNWMRPGWWDKLSRNYMYHNPWGALGQIAVANAGGGLAAYGADTDNPWLTGAGLLLAASPMATHYPVLREEASASLGAMRRHAARNGWRSAAREGRKLIPGYASYTFLPAMGLGAGVGGYISSTNKWDNEYQNRSDQLDEQMRQLQLRSQQ